MAYIKAKNLEDETHSSPVVLSAHSTGALKTSMSSPHGFEILFNRYIFKPIPEQKDHEFCFTDFINNKKKPNDEDYCIGYMMYYLKRAMGLSESEVKPDFSFSDLIFQDRFLFISDINLGIFVIELQDNDGTLEAVDSYLYAITSGPNDLHLERINEYSYSLVVTTTLQNEVLVFEEIEYNTILRVSSILILNRIHAYCIPKYYSFGVNSAINDNFLVNEMYNAKNKDVALRISSREDNTINDSTLKLRDIHLSVSSIIYLGFIETYTNVLFLVTADSIRLFRIDRPKVHFIAPPNTTELNLNDGYNETYWMKMGETEGYGHIFLFKKNSDLIVNHPDAQTDLYYKIYDQKFYFELKNMFIGPELNLVATPSLEYPTLNTTLLSPLFLKYNISDVDYQGFVKFANYPTRLSTLRNHVLFFNQDNVTTLSNDADFYDKYVPEYDMVKWQWIRGANFTTSVSYQNETSRNSYIYALSVVDEVPSFHVFIISDIVSWVGEIKLHNITDNGHKVKPIADMLNYIDNRIFYINAYEVRGGTTYNIFYFYKISDQGLNCFKIAETGKLFLAGTKVIKLRDSLFYVIYEYKDEFSVMNLYKNKDSFYKLYKLNTHDDVTYKSGK